MDPKLFAQRSKAILDRFDPDRARKRDKERPFMIELLGLSNTGKTTLMDRLYVAFKAAGKEVAKVPEGAEAVPPPRKLPVYNLETGDYAVAKARRFAYDGNIHLAVFDRAIFDVAVRMEMYAESGIITEDERDAFERTYLCRFNRDLFDLHVFLMCEPDAALGRKYGPDHAERAARGELKYSATTNPAVMAASHAAHQRVWDRHAPDPRLLWVDTTSLDQAQVADLVLEACLDAFERRLSAP
jgi:hypothetical protein